MRTRLDPLRADVVGKRLELLRAEIARDWPDPDAPAGGSAPESASESGDGAGEEAGDEAGGEVDGAAWWAGHTQVAGPVPAALLGAAPAAPAPPVPVPGRHAARRAAVAGLIPEQLRGRVALDPWHVVVLALGIAVALAIACWWVVRGASSPVPAPAPMSAAPLVSLPSASAAPIIAASPAVGGSTAVGGSVVPSAGASSSASGTTVTVDVEGKVRRPGIAVLPDGARVIDAIRAAGGAPRRRDLGNLNLAAVLTDGQQIVVGSSAPATTPSSGTVPQGSTGGASAPGGLINLNTATAEQLDSLPDVGPVTAQSILDWREQNGGFTSVDELLSVDGIGPATLAKIAPFVTV